MRQVEGIVRIRSSSVYTSLGGVFRDILGREERVAIFVFPRSQRQELFDERNVRFCLRWDDPGVFTCRPIG